MAAGLYSDGLEAYGRDISRPDLLASLAQLKTYLGVETLTMLQWDNDRVAIPLLLDVNLPGHGTFGGVDVRAQEPVLLVINPHRYPFIGPMVYPDRLDFPYDELGHMYVAQEARPPAFCLVRGNPHEWYQGKRLKDVVIRAANWLSDGAAGELSVDGNQFEPLRLDGYNGRLTYDYEELVQLVQQERGEGSSHALCLFEQLSQNNGGHWQFYKRVQGGDDITEALLKMAEEVKEDGSPKVVRRFGLVTWSTDGIAYKNYNADLPTNWGEFKTYCSKFGIEVDELDVVMASLAFRLFSGSILVVVGIQRPFPLIGLPGDIEFANFHLKIDKADIVDERLRDETKVMFKKHEQLLTPGQARRISGFAATGLTGHSLFVGLGAIGSRVALHLAKSGSVNFSYADEDSLAPHNFPRHVLGPHYTGMNKSVALVEELNELYPGGASIVDGAKALDYGISRSTLENKSYESIMDFTASPRFMRELVQANMQGEPRIVKGYVSDFGNLGILLFEGRGRNPRVDDLQAALYASARNVPELSAWLRREMAATVQAADVVIGVGCHSETTILSEDKIAIHAGLFSGAVKMETADDQPAEGRIYLSQLKHEPFFQSTSTFITVAPFDVLKAANDPSWEVRYAAGVLSKLKAQMLKEYPRETGGVFLGFANYNTRTVHVVDVIDAPTDSRANPVCFFRGIAGLSESIDQVVDKTGGQIGYIGEWHSHPHGPEELSQTDMRTVLRFRDEYAAYATPLPVFLTIITPTNILPFIF
ncbi:MAG: Mov34/MPN/PAD-1 family protein [Filimonas sp.]|nr:Mov34/MPN/PAD-1 family protein [Filimonas sp.]